MTIANTTRRLRPAGFVLAGCLSVAAALEAQTAASADLPDWWPGELAMPDDIQIESVREVGSQIRMLTFRTDRPADALLDLWTETLEGAGYSVDWSVNPDGPPSFKFTGEEIFNGQVVSTPCEEECVTRLQVDMTLK